MLRSGVQCWDASVRPTARVESLTVLLAACSLLCSERYIAESLFRHTRSVGWQTPRSSEALQAKKQIDEAFPRRIAGTILMAVEAPRNGTVLRREVEDFVANVSSKVTSDERVQQYKPHVLSYWTELGDIPSSVMSRKDFISADERMTLLLIQPTKIPENHDFAKANDFLQDFCSSPPLGFNLHITGAPALLTGSGCSSNSHAVVNPRDMSFKCLFFAEVITTPIALLIMGCIVRHWRLLILPLFTVCLSFAVSALMLIPWMDHVEVPTDAIAAMGSVILALSLDYSLFLLSRFSENHHDKFTLQENVDIIKACTCRTISISGLLVAIAFFAGILLPERNLQGTCIALGFAVLACVATNVVFLPAVFLAFGPVFVGRSFLPSWWGDVQLDDGAEEEDERQRPGPKSADNTNWLLIMRVVERAPLSAILLVLLFVWPVLSAAPSLHITADAGQNSLLRRPEAPEDLSGYEELLNGLACANRTESSPHNPHCNCCPNAFLECEECDLAATCASPEMQALLELAKEGNLTVDDSQLRSLKVCIERAAVAAKKNRTPPIALDQLLSSLRKVNQSAVQKGLLQRYPFLVDIVSQVQNLSRKERGMLLLPSGFHALLELSDKLQGTGAVASILGPQWILHQRLEWPLVVALAAKPELRHGYSALLEQFVNGKQALLQVHTHFPPIGALSADWAEEARGILRAWEHKHPGYKVQLAGGNAEAADTRAEIMRAMWTYLVVSISLIMIVLYLSFQSLLVPLRLALAMLFTLVATFGMGVLVYQTTLLHGFMPQLKYFNGVTYEVIPLVTGIAIALGLDYDIFLVSRIMEFRVQRYSDRASIFRGVLKTGDVISGAGLIMSLAFSGLIFSDKIFFQQFGVLIITSVLLDTFVVRTVLVPALMLIAQHWNWWPRSMPPPIHDVLEGEVESCGGLSRPILAQTSLDRMWQGAH